MANISYDGMNELMNAVMKDMNVFDDEAQEELLNAGADVTIDEVKSEMSRSKFDIEKFGNKIKKSKMKKDKNGVHYMTVSPSGTEHGQRIATILFVLNYGRSKKYGEITGGHFWTKAVKKSQTKAMQKFEETLKKILEERGL